MIQYDDSLYEEILRYYESGLRFGVEFSSLQCKMELAKSSRPLRNDKTGDENDL